ncbi:MAG TPA: 23S rRNA (adenine(2030)-N(6))-methyltransferase RlmJ [Opitutus sp.]|nr:23S rRNA (adenine(2030)-N(6))-methyltransferase RlmJ [Opitutus sp.]
MNYRHQFHAGNFADVMKHALLVQVVRAMQKKEKGFLFLDTHAGRGSYDLSAEARGDSLARRPEWPDGIGRLWDEEAAAIGAELAEYAELVRRFDAGKRDSAVAKVAAGREGAVRPSRGGEKRGGDAPPPGGDGAPRFYPGSPWIMRMIARTRDRLALCEKQPEEYAALAREFRRAAGTSVHEMDGYLALRAMLPPPERRALVLIDAPFEAEDEFARIATAAGEGLGRLPDGVLALWYPLTERARVDAFFAELVGLKLPPTLVLELAIAGETSGIRMRGCGLVLVNPPWRFEATAEPLLRELSRLLAQGEGAGARLDWLVPER